MNEEYIRHILKPYVFQDNKVTYDDFSAAFSMLSRKEQYKVLDLLVYWGFELVDENAFVNHTNQGITINKDVQKAIFLEDSSSISKPLNQRQFDFYETVSWNEKTSLTNEQLCLMYQKGDKTALGKLMVLNKKYVYSQANRYSKMFKHKLDFEDLLQAGYQGINEAAKRFDIARDCRFLTYAGWWIKQQITRTIIDEGFTIRIPVHIFEKIMKVYRIERDHIGEGDEVIYKAICEEMGITKERVDELRGYYNDVLSTASLNQGVGEDNDSELLDFFPDDSRDPEEEIIQDIYFNDILCIVKSSLKEREYQVLSLRLGLNGSRQLTLEQVGEIFGVTRERIRQIESKAIRKLRKEFSRKRYF